MKVAIRVGNANDITFVINLAIETAKYSVTPIRAINQELLAQRIELNLNNLAYNLNDPNLKLLIAETDKQETVGYLILLLNNIEATTGEPQAFVVDLAVSEEYWGKFVWRHLLRKAEEIARSEGLSYIAGTISVNNIRSLKTVQKFLGYQIERYQVGKRLF